MAAHVEVQGLRELRRNLRRLEADTADLKDANAAVAATVAAAAAARAPRRTGALAASVRGNRAVGGASVKGGGARVPYAGPVHWGWPARHITGQPFVLEAAEATEPLWLTTYAAALSAVVDRASHI